MTMPQWREAGRGDPAPTAHARVWVDAFQWPGGAASI
jgi:hypothetical protein